jgi:ATP-dependent DNA helicase RecG
VYPSGEGLSQTILRRAIADAMKRVDWRDTVPPRWRKDDAVRFRAGRAPAALPAAGVDETR